MNLLDQEQKHIAKIKKRKRNKIMYNQKKNYILRL